MSSEATNITYEELAALEDEFDEIDTQILIKQHELSAPAYAKRQGVVSKIPNFWPLVLEQAPPEIDQYISVQDSEIFSNCLTNVVVTRFEVEVESHVTKRGSGNPRSLRISLEFSENDHFRDKVLEKKFWYRRASDGWTGLVSEPVKVHWKKGKDLTKGLTDMSVALWAARLKAGDMKKRDLPAYEKLRKQVETWNGLNTSFFTWFGWVSGRRWVSAEESEKATDAHKATKAKKAKAEEDDDDAAGAEKEVDDDQDVEVHQEGDALAISFAEELWPSAIKYFTQAQEMDDADMSEMGFEEEDEDEDGDDEPVDIPSLVQGKGHKHSQSADGEGRPAKKAKK